jgi:hypothetical protein
MLASARPAPDLPEKNIENSCGFQIAKRPNLGIAAEFRW